MKLKSLIPKLVLLFVLTVSLYVFPATSQRPHMDEIYFKIIDDPNDRVNAMIAGEVDVLKHLDRSQDIIELQDHDPQIQFAVSPGFHMCYVAFNMRRWPFSFIPHEAEPKGTALRHAIAHLVPKDEIIENLFAVGSDGMYNVTKLDTFVGPAHAKWYMENVDRHPYIDTEQAKAILTEAGYEYDDDTGNWTDPDGNVLGYDRDTGEADPWEFLSPTEEAAPSSYQLVAWIVENMQSVGLPVIHVPVPFSHLQLRAFGPDHDFDMYFLCWHLGRFPDFLFYLFHSSEDKAWGYNSPGIHDSQLDGVLETIISSLDESAIETAVDDAQLMLAGDPVYTHQNTTDGLLPYIPIYQRNTIAAFASDLNENGQGIWDNPGFGPDNRWTYQRIDRPGGPETKTLNCCIFDNPETLNPCFAGQWYEWEVLDRIYDPLIAQKYKTHEPKPILVRESGWTVVPDGATGMNITFRLREDVRWHDGYPFTADDVVFALNYTKHWKIEFFWQHLTYANVSEHLVSVERENDFEVKVQLNIRSLWYVYYVADIAAMFPKHIWESHSPYDFNFSNIQDWLIGTGPYKYDSYIEDAHIHLIESDL